MEHKSVSIYMYRWGCALYRSSGIRPSEERHPHVIKDFISSLKKNIRNKIANRWAEMHHPPNTVERAFELASDVEKQLQVTDSFKLEFPTYPSRELEMSAEETSGDEQEVNEIARNRKCSSPEHPGGVDSDDYSMASESGEGCRCRRHWWAERRLAPARLNLPIFLSTDVNADVTYEIWPSMYKAGWISMMKRVCAPTSSVAYKVILENGLAPYQEV